MKLKILDLKCKKKKKKKKNEKYCKTNIFL